MIRNAVLILGGTGEGRELAAQLSLHPRLAPVSSLAGVTTAPVLPAGESRSGGFGGVEGLVDWLRANPVLAVVDATHPFATIMTAQVIEATRRLDLPCLRLEREPWEEQPGDRWHEVDELEEALAILPRLGRRVLAALGRSWAERLPERADIEWILRSIERPPVMPAGATWLQMRPPFWVDGERRLLIEQRIEVILTKAAGGEGARAKLGAARLLGLPVVLLRRPPPPRDVPIAQRVEEVVAWLDQLLAARGRST